MFCLSSLLRVCKEIFSFMIGKLTISATTVMVLGNYEGTKFGDLEINAGTLDECLTQIRTFTASNVFTQSNTFTESILFGATLSATVTLSLLMSVTQMMTVQRSLTLSFSLSAIGSLSTHVQTELVYYEYKVIAYSSYFFCYSYFYSYYFLSESPKKVGETIVIFAVCVAIAVIIILSLLIFLLIRILSKKQASGKLSVDSFKQIDCGTNNTFTAGLKMIHLHLTSKKKNSLIKYDFLPIL